MAKNILLKGPISNEGGIWVWGDVQDHDAKADCCATKLAFGLVAKTEGRAVAIVLPGSNIHGTASYPFRVPERDGNEGCEPEYCV